MFPFTVLATSPGDPKDVVQEVTGDGSGIQTCYLWATLLSGPFSKGPLGVEEIKAVTPTPWTLPTLTSSCPCMAAASSAAGLGFHLHVWDLKSEEGAEGICEVPWPLCPAVPQARLAVEESWGCALLLHVAPEWKKRRGLRGLLCPPGILSLRTPSLLFTAQILCRAHHSPEKHIGENSIRKGH